MIRQNRKGDAAAPRRGITMIETLMLVTCVAIVLGLAALTIQVMLRLVADSQTRLSSSLMVDRLARQFRADVHLSAIALDGPQGGKAQAPRKAVNLTLEAGHAVTYKMLATSIDRDETVGGKRVRHESFVLPRGREARFELGAEAGRATVSLLIEPGADRSAGGVARALEVLAVVGKHRGAAIEKTEGAKP
jgi:heme/copper-type cytochrome/quinol oxidase subunit 2